MHQVRSASTGACFLKKNKHINKTYILRSIITEQKNIHPLLSLLDNTHSIIQAILGRGSEFPKIKQLLKNIFLHLPSFSIVFHSLPSSSTVFHHLPSSSIIFQHLPTSSIIFNHLPASSISFQHLPELARLPKRRIFSILYL